LVYTEPQTDIASDEIANFISEGAFFMKFKTTLKRVELRADGMLPELLQRAREIFDMESPPEGRDGCRDCELLRQLLTIV
jgi:hypothetical protein